MGLSAQSFIDEIVSNTSKYGMQNKMSYFFGINNKNIDQYHFQKCLNNLKSELLLVVILERMNTSLVLLKRLLNWSFIDILYAKRKTNNHIPVFLNEKQTEHLRTTNSLDYGIYNYFSKELDQRIEKEGNDFTGEVRYFEHILNELNTFCRQTFNKSYIHTFPLSRWDNSFSISLKECDMMFKMDVSNFKSGHPTLKRIFHERHHDMNYKLS
ncbi:galactosylceramide sulfotransferase-like [Mercenaria mercenaria]|uniref:galactosylceramide sulfotransferase-like n=1 Tax=Mercenaria mercenaria TaxID=6596 RepID=UPI00234E73CB|nr:galactosylceramide sulfotransferase-like [Mercenaria mercenaria]